MSPDAKKPQGPEVPSQRQETLHQLGRLICKMPEQPEEEGVKKSPMRAPCVRHHAQHTVAQFRSLSFDRCCPKQPGVKHTTSCSKCLSLGVRQHLGEKGRMEDDTGTIVEEPQDIRCRSSKGIHVPGRTPPRKSVPVISEGRPGGLCLCCLHSLHHRQRQP